jgi:type II secretory pathway pseudopilin PulG
MNGTIIAIIVVAVVVIVIAAVAIALVSRKKRQERERQEEAHQEYGAEYERAREEQGSDKKAESELRERREKVESEIQPLSDESSRKYAEQWEEVERTFVDDPSGALDGADRLVAEIMEERNFPTGSRDEASKSLGVMHSDVVEDFREAQRVHQGATRSSDKESSNEDSGGEDLEKMREAIKKYRSVYERLTQE